MFSKATRAEKLTSKDPLLYKEPTAGSTIRKSQIKTNGTSQTPHQGLDRAPRAEAADADGNRLWAPRGCQLQR